jgi:hypothetical protein
MNAIGLLEKLKSIGIDIALDGEDLKVIGQNSKLTPDLLSEIRHLKPQILAILRAPSSQRKSNAYKAYDYPDGSRFEFSEEDFDEIVSFFSIFIDSDIQT